MSRRGFTKKSGYNFRVYDRIVKRFTAWTGFFIDESSALEWLKSFGKYWRDNGYIVHLFLNNMQVMPEITNKDFAKNADDKND